MLHQSNKRLLKRLYFTLLPFAPYKSLLITLICILLFSLSHSTFAASKTVSVVTLFDYAPYCMVDEGFSSAQFVKPGEDAIGFRGYSWDVLRESYHIMGYSIELKIVPWARAVSMLKSSQAQILFPTGVNREREKIFYYSNEDINSANFRVYVNTDSQIEWQGLSSLTDLSIGVIGGFNYGDKWRVRPRMNTINVNTILQGFRMLKAKRIDGFLGYETNWDYMLNQYKWSALFKKLPAFDSSNEFLVALKTNPNAKTLLHVFDTGKQRLIESGRLEQMHEKWFGKKE